MRPGLLAIAVGSHQKSRRELAVMLLAVIDGERMMVFWYAFEVLEESSKIDEFRQQATDQHREAQRLLEELARSFRDETTFESAK